MGGEEIRTLLSEQGELPVTLGVTANRLLSIDDHEDARPSTVKEAFTGDIPERVWQMLTNNCLPSNTENRAV